MKRIGGIYACIDGDSRYGTDISVYVSESWNECHDGGSFIEIRLIRSSPVGGMDGPGGNHIDDSKVLERFERSKNDRNDAKKLLTSLRRHFKTADGGTVARYGRPTINFKWEGIGRGLNTALAIDTLSRVG